MIRIFLLELFPVRNMNSVPINAIPVYFFWEAFLDDLNMSSSTWFSELNTIVTYRSEEIQGLFTPMLVDQMIKKFCHLFSCDIFECMELV